MLERITHQTELALIFPQFYRWLFKHPTAGRKKPKNNRINENVNQTLKNTEPIQNDSRKNAGWKTG